MFSTRIAVGVFELNYYSCVSRYTGSTNNYVLGWKQLMKWPIVQIDTLDGVKNAIAPLIISASRATDIPAFHSQWFLHRLATGFCVWFNPFNNQKQYISFENTKAVVFWSKNPAPMLKRLDEVNRFGFCYYFQFTLNNYESERLEPNVPPLEERIKTFKLLSQKVGKEQEYRCLATASKRKRYCRSSDRERFPHPKMFSGQLAFRYMCKASARHRCVSLRFVRGASAISFDSKICRDIRYARQPEHIEIQSRRLW